MATMEIDGLEDYQRMLEKLGADADYITGKAIYAGANIIADAVKASIRALPVDGRHGTPDDPINGVTKTQKEDLAESFGIAPIGFTADTNYKNVKLGFDGYGRTKTKKYPKGQPNQLIARSVESGTSFRKKHPFVRPVVNKMKNAAIEKMENVVDEEIKRRF